MTQPAKKAKPPMAININLDTTPILYTDNVFMTTNEFGVIFDIAQKVGDKMRIVSRIGMSRKHAKKFVTELSKLLAITEQQAKQTRSKSN